MKIVENIKTTWKDFVDNKMEIYSFRSEKFELSITNSDRASMNFDVKRTMITIKNYTIFCDVNGGSFEFTPNKGCETTITDDMIKIYDSKIGLFIKILR